jgi:tetratricopeptide (TPR) repeat protein
MADPFSALGVTLSIIQIVTLAASLASKIWKFTDERATLPEDLESIKQRLDIVVFTLKELNTSDYSEEAARSLEIFLTGIDKKLTKFQQMLDEYLPAVGASTIVRLKKGFQSFGKDSRVMEFAEQLSKDVDHLTLFIMTQGLKQPAKQPTSHLGGRTVYEVARRGVAKFVGREGHLAALDAALNSAPRVAVLQGMGGQGKTQIALEYCRRCRLAKKYNAILWANASSEQSLRDSFESFSDVLKPADESFVDSDSRVRFTKSILTDWPEPWLLVLDNFDDPSKFSIRDYMPASVQGRIIFTTRSGEVRMLGNPIPVAGMTDDEALDLLTTSGNLDKKDETNVVEGAKIVDRLGNMPLAVDLAGTYLGSRAGLLRVQDFLARYNAQAEAIMQVLPGVSDYSVDMRQNDTSVFATWELMVQVLEPQTELGAQKVALLNILGFFNGKNISEELFRTYYTQRRNTEEVPQWFQLFTDDRGEWNSLAFEDLIVQLGTMSLVERPSRNDAGHAQFSIHPLISDWLRIRQTRESSTLSKENYQRSAKMLACCLKSRYVEFLLQPAFRLPFREQNSLTSHLLFREGLSGSLRNRTPIYLGDSEPMQCVELIFIMHLYDVGFNPDSLRIAERLWDECGISTKQGRLVKRAAGAYLWHNRCTVQAHAAAEKRMREVAEFWSQALGPMHSFTLEAEYYAAASLSYLGDMDGAAKMYKSIVSHADSDEWKQSCNENTWFPRPEWSLVELIYVLGAQRSANKKAEVPAITKRVLDMRVKSPTVRHGSTQWNWRCYGVMIKTLEDKAVSSSISWELLSIIEKVWGKTHSNYFLAQIAVMEALLDRETEASSERILAHLLQSVGRTQYSLSYRYLLWGLQNLSQLLLARNKLTDAEQVLRQMLGVYEDLPQAASAQDSVLKDLGRCLYLQGRANSADDAFAIISSPGLDVLILHSLAKYKIGTKEKLQEASSLLEKALDYFKIENEEPNPADADPSGGFSLEMMLTGVDESAPRNKYKLDVNGSVSFEVLVLLGLCQVRINDIANGRHSISDGENAFEDGGGVEAGLTEGLGTFIADRSEELLESLQAPESDPLDSAATEEVAGLLDWAATQVTKHLTNDELLHRLRGLAKDVRSINDSQNRRQDNLVDDMSVLSVYGGEEKKSKLTRLAKTILSSSSLSKKSGAKEEDKNRTSSFSSDAITLTPSRTSTMKPPPEDPGRMKPAEMLSTSPHYHVPGELPQGEA